MTNYLNFYYFDKMYQSINYYNTYYMLNYPLEEEFKLMQKALESEANTTHEKMIVSGRVFFMEFYKHVRSDVYLMEDEDNDELFCRLSEILSIMVTFEELNMNSMPGAEEYIDALIQYKKEYKELLSSSEGICCLIYSYIISEIEYLIYQYNKTYCIDAENVEE